MTYLPFLALSLMCSAISLGLKWLTYGPSLFPSKPRRCVLAKTILACPEKQKATKERIVKFDTNTKPILVDNRCSACISPYIEDFVGPLEDTNKTIKGFAGAQTNNPKTGTLWWQWSEDSGKMHTFAIPNSNYVPECELRLLSPQHWAQTRSHVNWATTGCITSLINVYLSWTKGDENYELTLPLNKRGANVGTLYSHPGYNKYDLFCQATDIKLTDDKNPIAILGNLISEDEGDEEDDIQPQIGPPPISIPREIICPRGPHYSRHQKTLILILNLKKHTCMKFASVQTQRVSKHRNYPQSSRMMIPQ